MIAKNLGGQLSGGVAALKVDTRRVLFAYILFIAAALAIFSSCFAFELDTLSAGRSRVLRLVQLGLITALSIGFLLYLWRKAWPDAASARILRVSSVRLGVGCAGLALLGAALIAMAVLQSVSLSGDEGAYLFQADLFAQARLWAVSSPIQTYIAQHYIFSVGDKIVSQYPPGWPAVLALTGLAGFPLILVNPVIGMLLVVATYRFALAQYGREVAVLSALILTVSAFFLFNSASFFNGSIVALLGVLFVTSACSFIDRPGIGAAIGFGFWFSAIAVARHFDALLFAAPVAVVLLWHSTARHWRLTPVAAAAAVPLFGLLLYYYWQITGDPLVLPQKLHNSSDGLLGPNWHAVRVTEILIGRLVELAEWVSPPFVIAFLWALAQKLRRGKLRFFDLYGPLFLAGYWLYWADGTFRWGPRYIYPAFPFMVLLIAERAWHALQAERDRRRAAFAHLVLVSTIVSMLQVPFLAARGRELISQTQDISRQVRDAGVQNAVVIAVSGTGVIWQVDVGDLARNGLTLDKNVVYAHGPGLEAARITPSDIEQAVQELRAFFPTRGIWLYYRDRNSATGRLVRT